MYWCLHSGRILWIHFILYAGIFRKYFTTISVLVHKWHYQNLFCTVGSIQFSAGYISMSCQCLFAPLSKGSFRNWIYCKSLFYVFFFAFCFQGHADVAHYIPEHRFRFITIAIVLLGLLIGIMIPSVELVIGLVGSTIGVAICVMFPASCFIKISKKDSTEKLLAQVSLTGLFCFCFHVTQYISIGDGRKGTFTHFLKFVQTMPSKRCWKIWKKSSKTCESEQKNKKTPSLENVWIFGFSSFP